MAQLRLRTRGFTLAGVTGACVLVDQVTKLWAIHALRGQGASIYLHDLFRFQYAENAGAFLSLGAGLPPTLRFLFLTVLVGGFLAFSSYLVMTQKALSRRSLWSYSLLIGGGVSNFGDRLFREHGHVVDFMNLGWGNLRTGIFNVADIAIMVGVGLLLLTTLREQPKK